MADRARGYAPTLIAGLAGAVAVTVGSARPWVSATAAQAGLPSVSVSLAGADVVPLVGALGVVLLAAFGAVVATRGWVRRAIGVVIVVCATTVVALTVRPGGVTGALESELSDHGWTGGPYDQATEAWRWLVLVGAVVCLAAGLAVAAWGARWATMGARYDRPVAPTAATGPDEAATPADDSWSEQDLWKAIDQGKDPTRATGTDGGGSQ